MLAPARVRLPAPVFRTEPVPERTPLCVAVPDARASVVGELGAEVSTAVEFVWPLVKVIVVWAGARGAASSASAVANGERRERRRAREDMRWEVPGRRGSEGAGSQREGWRRRKNPSGGGQMS